MEYILIFYVTLQIGTINFCEPAAAVRILSELEQEMEKLHINNLSEIRGKLTV